MFGHEPLSDAARDEQLRVLVGLGAEAKPFECVGDPDESAVALRKVSHMDEWRDVPRLVEIAGTPQPSRSFDELLEPQGPIVFQPTGFADLAGRRVGIFGYGIEGRAAVDLTARHGRVGHRR